MACSFRSASSRCASVDFTAFAAFPFAAFGAMAEAMEEIDGAGGGGGNGGGALLSFGFGSGGERRRFLRLELRVAKVGNGHYFPCL